MNGGAQGLWEGLQLPESTRKEAKPHHRLAWLLASSGSCGMVIARMPSFIHKWGA